MAQITTSLPVPEQLQYRLAVVTRGLIGVVEILDELWLPEAKRLRATVCDFAGDNDDALDAWIDQSGLQDLLDVVHLVQSQAADFTESMARTMSREQVREQVDLLRESVAGRLARVDR